MGAMQASYALNTKPQASTFRVYYPLVLTLVAFTLVILFVSLFAPDRLSIPPIFASALVLVSLIVFAIFAWLHLYNRSASYTITDTHAEARYGVLYRYQKSLQLCAVRSIKVQQDLIQRWFDVGDVILYTTSHDKLVLHDLADPEAAKEIIWQRVQKAAR